MGGGVVKVLILGSCVTRDAFEFADDYPPLSLYGYYARSALVSATDTRPFVGVPLDNITSPFQRRMVEWDITGAVLEDIARADYDVLVYDAIDERYPLLVQETGAYATLSGELRSSGYDHSADHVVRQFSDEAFDLWRQGWARFVAALDAAGTRRRLRINRVWWASRVEDGGQLPPAHSPELIARANAYLARLYGEMNLEPWQFVDFDGGELVAAKEHRWGVMAFHYPDQFSHSLLRQLLIPAGALSGHALP
jgi:hypothetical protein